MGFVLVDHDLPDGGLFAVLVGHQVCFVVRGIIIFSIAILVVFTEKTCIIAPIILFYSSFTMLHVVFEISTVDFTILIKV